MSRSLILPLRTLLCPRPAIQAWRSARCFATEVSYGSQSTLPFPLSAEPSIEAAATLPTQSSPFSGSVSVAAADGLEDREKPKPRRGAVGVVVSAGKMQKTVKVRIPGQKLNKHLRKYFRQDTNHLVHDPNSSLNIGDVVSLSPHRAAKHVHHIVSEILVPFGPPITDRPPVPSEAERKAEYEAKRSVKVGRRRLRRAAAQGSTKAIEGLRAMGLDAQPITAAGLGDKNAKSTGQVGDKSKSSKA